jgi:hypothetical protein
LEALNTPIGGFDGNFGSGATWIDMTLVPVAVLLPKTQ